MRCRGKHQTPDTQRPAPNAPNRNCCTKNSKKNTTQTQTNHRYAGSCSSSGGAVDVSLSENSFPGECYRLTPHRYNNTFRIESNNQLYEGVRYVIINVSSTTLVQYYPSAPP